MRLSRYSPSLRICVVSRFCMWANGQLIHLNCLLFDAALLDGGERFLDDLIILLFGGVHLGVHVSTPKLTRILSGWT